MLDLPNVSMGNACGMAALTVSIVGAMYQPDSEAALSKNRLAENAPWFATVVQILYSNPMTALTTTILVIAVNVAVIYIICDSTSKRWFSDSGHNKKPQANHNSTG